MAELKWRDEAHKKLFNFIKDITTLEVVTLSGNLTVADIKLTGDDKIDFNKVMDSIKGTATDDSAISIVAATNIDIDKDIQQFVKEGMSTEDKELFNMHVQAIQYAQEARKATFEMLLSLVRG